MSPEPISYPITLLSAESELRQRPVRSVRRTQTPYESEVILLVLVCPCVHHHARAFLKIMRSGGQNLRVCVLHQLWALSWASHSWQIINRVMMAFWSTNGDYRVFSSRIQSLISFGKFWDKKWQKRDSTACILNELRLSLREQHSILCV